MNSSAVSAWRAVSATCGNATTTSASSVYSPPTERKSHNIHLISKAMGKSPRPRPRPHDFEEWSEEYQSHYINEGEYLNQLHEDMKAEEKKRMRELLLRVLLGAVIITITLLYVANHS